jgi:DNA-binding response OmpR family regulator
VLLAAHGARVRSDGGEYKLGIEWPVCPAGQPGAGSRGLLMTDQPRELAGWHIAVVEDEPRELDLLRDVLHARGAKVSAFGAAGDFLRWAGGGPAPDLLIVDQVLDELSGEVLAGRMHELSPGTPVLLIGARLQAGAPEWAAGRPLRTLPKPFAFADLFAALKALPKCSR